MKSKLKGDTLKGEVRRLIRSGYAVIPVPKSEKAPTLPGWPNLRLVEEDIDKYFSESGNVGVLLGKPSRGLTDIDLDAPEAADVADLLLPQTGMVHGRKSKPRSHRFYRIGNPLRPMKFTDTDGSCLVEIRSTGQQTLLPFSLHPSGERFRWEEQGPPKKLKPEELVSRVKMAAASTVLVRHYPSTGDRHEFAMALSGTLLQSGWSLEEATKFVSATARAAGDEEWKARARDVVSTAEKITKEQPVTGANRLKELAGDKVVARVQEWLELSNRGPEVEHLTDLGNAGRFVAQHGGDVRFCHITKRFLTWDGSSWRNDESGEVERRAKQTVRQLYAEASRIIDDELRAETVKWARSSESRGRITAMIELAKSEPTIPVSPPELDANPWLLNCQNGTIDLYTGDLMKHRRRDLCTKIIPVDYDPKAICPVFKKFLRRILKENSELINFLQRAIGYALTGSTLEQVLFILWGGGANGKSTLLEVIRAILGDYGRTADSALLMHHKQDGVRNDVARLAGARFVSTAETEAGRHMAEVLVKQLTGGDKVPARFLYSEFFEFDAQFKLFLTTNHKPVIRGTDNAIWRRIRLIPFEVTIPEEEQDKDLPRKLRSELPGVLAWAVRGCLRWQEYGLGQPEKVSIATEAYRQEMDIIGAFLKDCCLVRKDGNVKAGQLYPAYKKWCDDNGERPLTQQKLGGALRDRSFRPYRTGRVRSWRGLALRDTSDGGDVTLG
jgi:putative DNA primase/helicase